MAKPDHRVTLLTNACIPAASKLLADVFFTDLLMVTLFPNDQERAGVLNWYCTAAVRSLANLQGVYTTEDSVKGVAVWVPPGMEEEVPDWTEPIEGHGYQRFLKALDYLTFLRHEALPGPFWYLSWIGVSPACRSQGVGSALLAPVLQRADQAGLPCYLETFEHDNLFFYQPHGFDVVFSRTEPESNLSFWALKREPR